MAIKSLVRWFTSLNRLWIGALALCVMLCVSRPAAGTILTFDMTSPTPASGSFMSAYNTYGDRVSATSYVDIGPSNTDYGYLKGNGFTPNVEVDYSSVVANRYRFWQDVNWPSVGYLFGTGLSVAQAQYDTIFTPDDGYGVRVNSFVMDAYTTSSHIINW